MKRQYLAACAALLAVSCTTEYVRAPDDDAQARDLAQCKVQAQAAAAGLGGLVYFATVADLEQKCMRGKGWVAR